MVNFCTMQWDIHEGDVAYNHRKVAELVEKACATAVSPDAVLLPELWSTGYVLERAAELASPEGERDAAFLGELARKYGVQFTGGSVLSAVEGGVTNRALIIGANGAVSAFYDKIHLVPMLDEHLYLKAGRSYCHYTVGGFHCGAIICYDLRFVELLRRYALEGAELITVAAEWPLARHDHWRTLLRARAIENQSYIVASNHCGVKGRMAFSGSSMIIDPLGTILADLGYGEGFVTLPLDPEKVKAARMAVPVFKDRVPEVY